MNLNSTSKACFKPFFIIFLLCFSTNHLFAKPIPTEKHWEMALYFYSIGSYAEAEMETMKILHLKRNRKSIDRSYISLLLLQSKAIEKQFRFKEAKRIASKADGYVKILTKAGLRIEGNLLLCDYYLEEGNILSASNIFEANIPDSLFVTSISKRIQADAILVKGSILAHQGYAKKAIPLLKQAAEYFNSHLSGLPDDEKYYAKQSLNQAAINEKYALANYILAFAQLKYGSSHDAETTLLNLISWASANLDKDHYFRYRPWKLLGDVYEQRNMPEKAIDAYSKAYTENPHIDNEYEKQEALLNLILKNYAYGSKLEARNYMRRLEMKAATNIGSKEPSQFAYELALSYSQFFEQSYKTSLSHLARLEKLFLFVPDLHPYAKTLYSIKKEVYYYQGNYAAYQTVIQKQAKLRAKSLGEDCPEFQRYQMEVALAEVSFGQELSKAKRIFKGSYFNTLQNEIEFSSPENIKYLTGLSDFYFRLSVYDSCHITQKKAAEAALELHGENGTTYIAILAKLAELELLTGSYSKSTASLENAEKLSADKRGLNTTNLSLQLQLARIHRLTGNFAKSTAHFAVIKRLTNAIQPLPFMWKQLVETEHAQLYFDEGIFYKANKTSTAARVEGESLAGKSVPWLLSAYDTEAKVNIVSGNFANSTQALNNAFGVTVDSTFDRSEILLVQSDYFIAISDYSEALDEAIQADEIRKIKLGNNHFYRYETLAKIASIKSLLPNADANDIENLYKQAMSIISASLGDQNVFYFKTEQKLAEFFLKRNRVSEALPYLLKELGFWENMGAGAGYTIASIKGLIGTAYYLQNDYSSAEQYYTDAARAYRLLFNDKHPDYLKIQSKLARVYYMKDEAAKSVSIMKEIVNSAIEYSRNYFSSLSFRQRNRYWNSFKDEFEFYTFLMVEKNGENGASSINDLYNVVISTKGMLLSTDIKLRKKIINGKDTVLTRIFTNWLAQKELLTYSVSLSADEQKEQGIYPKNVEQQIEKLEKEMNQRSDIFKSEGKKNSINMQSVVLALEPNEYAIEMVRYRHFNKVFTDSVKYAALIVTKNNAPEMVVLPNGSFLERRMLKYYRNAMIFGEEDEISFENYWKPIKEKLRDSATVYLSAEGVYNQINIETMRNEDKKYAIDKNRFVYLTNTKDIVSSLEEEKSQSKSSYIICGNPSFYSATFTGIESIQSLAGAEREVMLVDDILHKGNKKTYRLISNEVQESVLKKMNNPRVFHIATHGYFKEDDKNVTANEDHNPLLNSGLLLSGSGDILGGKENTFINKKDGILTAYEALDLNFDQTDLVILSACETGRGEVQAGEGVYGLQRAFLIAGSKAVILSLFKVNDDVTQLLMKEFYIKWLFSGDARASFVHAKQKIKEFYPDPIYWGAFVMIESNPKGSKHLVSSFAKAN